MQLVRGYSVGRELPSGCALTIGAYDGIHLGHQTLIARLHSHARALGAPAVLLTFEPMPREFLAPAAPPARLTSLRERVRILAPMGLSALWLLRFGEALRNLSAADFAALVARELEPRVIVVGHDFRFGRSGEATAATLAQAGQRLGFEVDVLDPIMLGGERISSSGIRAALAAGDFATAARWLGRPWSMRGRVLDGERLGRKLGFPTANLRLERRRAPVGGIFAVRVHGAGPQAAARGGEPRHAPDGGRSAAAARGARFRFRRRSVRSGDRGGVRSEAAR